MEQDGSLLSPHDAAGRAAYRYSPLMGYQPPASPLPVPEYNDSGDPQWIDVPLIEGGALNGVDRYVPYGRWRERLFDASAVPLKSRVIALSGLREALLRAWKAITPDVERSSEAQPDESVTDTRERRIAAVTATYDALEWIHSVDEHYKQDGLYADPTLVDPVPGAFLIGALGARHASHHGLRQVVDYVKVERPIFAAKNFRWEHTGLYVAEVYDMQLRWVEQLPARQEAHGEPGTIRSKSLERAFETNLAGREVRNSLALIADFLFFTAIGSPVPRSSVSGAEQHAVDIDPRGLGDPHWTHGS